MCVKYSQAEYSVCVYYLKAVEGWGTIVIFDQQKNVFTQCLCCICGWPHTGLRTGQSEIDYCQMHGTFRRLCILAKSLSYPSVRLCVRIYQIGSHSTDFMKFYTGGFYENFRGSPDLIKVLQTCRVFTWRAKCLAYCWQWRMWRNKKPCQGFQYLLYCWQRHMTIMFTRAPHSVTFYVQCQSYSLIHHGSVIPETDRNPYLVYAVGSFPVGSTTGPWRCLQTCIYVWG